MHEVEQACSSGSRASIDGQVLLDHRPRRAIATADRGRDLACRHGASPRIRGTRNRSVLGRRRLREHLVAVEARAHLVGPQHVDQRQRVGGRGHALEVERGDVLPRARGSP